MNTFTKFTDSYTRTKSKDGKVKITGTIVYNDCPFRFRVNEISYTTYNMRGCIYMLSPKTGNILQVKKDQKSDSTDSKKSQYMPIKTDKWLRTTDDETILAELKSAAKDLYIKYKYALDEELRLVSTDHLSIATIVHTHAEKFLNRYKPDVTDATRRTHLHRLERLASDLKNYTMASVSMNVLKKLYKEYGKIASAIFRLAAIFWSYCTELGIYQGKNVFEEHLAKYAPTRTPVSEEMALKQLRPKSLPENVERTILQRIMHAPADDAFITCALLICCFGLTATEAHNSKWGDIVFNLLGIQIPHAQIIISKENIAGATHDYTRPGFLIYAEELYRRYRELQLKYPDLDDRYILTDENGKRISYQRLTAFCKSFLIHCGLKYEDLKSAEYKLYGAGVSLLLAHYKYRITAICGMSPDEGVTLFLCGRSLQHDVTSSNYRSFTSHSGQVYNLKVLSRDKRFYPANDEPIKVTVDNETTTITAIAKNPETFTHTDGAILLQPGDYLEINASCIVHGTIKTKPYEP